MKYSILLATFVALSFSSCAALTRYKCNREYAARKGMEDANSGQLSMPGRLEGSSCEGEYSPSDYSKDYNYGFQQKKAEICQLATATAAGKTDGDLGNTAKPQKTKFQICQDQPVFRKLEPAYESAFQKAFCSTTRASASAESLAQNWKAAAFEETFASCGNASSLKRTFDESYKRKFRENCSTLGAAKFGEDEARANREMHEGQEKMRMCEAVGGGNFVLAFESSYLATKAKLSQEQKEREAQEQERIRQVRVQEFLANVATTNFFFANKSLISKCTVAADRSYIQTEVENRYPEQVLVQGKWRIQYYGADFQKITEDQTVEAVLITPQNKKTFQKMTLPRDAAYCRAEYLGA